ncbi:hypothetical protein [Desulfolutivibrio sp.]|uniref:hypothetical protein n=1 Tax=Desulfolutivibrio sp. TaxID=2773296 RepID=UPI002F96BDFE
MFSSPKEFLTLHDVSGKPLGVFIGSEIWETCKNEVLPILTQAMHPEPVVVQRPPEPLKDWEALLGYWDFTYPPAYDLVCENCGAATDDWRADDPRKFWLTAANLGGLASFQCLHCKSRIMKRHFKKHVSVECRPYVDKS